MESVKSRKNLTKVLSNLIKSDKEQNGKACNGDNNNDDIAKEKSKNRFHIDRRVASVLFIITCAILVGKLFLALKPLVLDNLYSRKIIREDFINNLGLPMMRFEWKTESNVPQFVWPLICGLSVAIFSWTMIYLDSKEPGVNPPMPSLSPKKERTPIRYKSRSDGEIATFSFSYVMSIACGISVFVLLYMVDL